MELEIDKKFNKAVKTKIKGTNLAVIPSEIGSVSMEIQEGWVSYQYGVKIKAPIVKYSLKSGVPFSFSTILYPYSVDIDIGEVIKQVQDTKWMEILNETGF